MNVIWCLTFLVLFLKVEAYIELDLPCTFNFDKKFGYTCQVTNWNNSYQNANISKIVGKHELNDHHDHDVYRLTFWNITISYLPANITLHFSKLRTLQVKQCGLKALTRAADFIKLRRLYLGFNDIKRIPTTYFWHFCRLEVLSLFHNQISSIPSMAFRDLINLKRLSLNSNHLKSIDARLFSNNVNMEVVDLDNNRMKEIDGNLFANLARMRKIFMRSNKLVTIDDHFLETISDNIIANFSKNPCIDFTLPIDGNYKNLQIIFHKNCSYIEPTTIAPETSSKKIFRTKKPKYKTLPIIYYENCSWNVRKEYHHLYRHFLDGLE